MFPNLKTSTSRLLTATCFLTFVTATACGSDNTDNDQTASGQSRENNPTTTGTTGGAGGSKTTAAAGRGGSGGSSVTSTGTAGRTSTTNNGVSGTAGTVSSAGAAGRTTAASAGASGSTSAGSGAAAGSSGGGAAGSAGNAAGSGGAAGAGAAGAAGKAGAGGAGGKGGAGGAGGARSATDGDQSLTTMPDPSLVAGTGNSCQSYTEPANGKCGGWYCGVDQATLTKAVDPMAVCGGNIDLLCSNAVTTAVASCARSEKTANITATNDELRPKVRDCVFQDTTIQQGATPDCVNCLIDAAACASDNCLTQCLTGDSPGCDSCRKQNNCDQMVFSCGGIPSPLN